MKNNVLLKNISIVDLFINGVYYVLVGLFPFLKRLDYSGVWELYGFDNK